MGNAQRPIPILIKFESQISMNLVLKNTPKLKSSEVFDRIILKIYKRRPEKNPRNRCFRNKKKS